MNERICLSRETKSRYNAVPEVKREGWQSSVSQGLRASLTWSLYQECPQVSLTLGH